MPIEYDGPRDIENMWKARRFLDVRDANASGRRIMAARAVFRDWRLVFEAMFAPEIINERDIRMFAEMAGRMIGVGTYRRLFGRFSVA
jgi:hypothetical protein